MKKKLLLLILFSFFTYYTKALNLSTYNNSNFENHRSSVTFNIYPETYNRAIKGSESPLLNINNTSFSPPVFESLSSIVVEEGVSTSTTVLDINANDGSGGIADINVTYSLSGTDASDFNIDTNSGILTFASSPDWENPADTNTDNIYEITVTANNGSETTDQSIKVFVFPESDTSGISWQQLGQSI